MDVERRQRVLTDDDIKALAEAIKPDTHCQFKPDEVSTIRDVLKRMDEAKSVIWKGFLYVIFVALVAIGLLSYSHKLKLP